MEKWFQHFFFIYIIGTSNPFDFDVKMWNNCKGPCFSVFGDDRCSMQAFNCYRIRITCKRKSFLILNGVPTTHNNNNNNSLLLLYDLYFTSFQMFMSSVLSNVIISFLSKHFPAALLCLQYFFLLQFIFFSPLYTSPMERTLQHLDSVKTEWKKKKFMMWWYSFSDGECDCILLFIAQYARYVRLQVFMESIENCLSERHSLAVFFFFSFFFFAVECC